LELLREFPSTQSVWQHDISQQQVDFISVFLPDPERFHARSRLDDVIAIFLEHAAREFAQGRIVFDEKNGFGTARERKPNDVAGLCWQRCRAPREMNGERCSLVQMAAHFNPAIVLLYDSMHRRQSKAGAFPRLFRGEE